MAWTHGSTDRKVDVSIRFVEALAPTRLRMLDGGTMGYDEDGVYFLDPPGAGDENAWGSTFLE
jgi:hypothetical protein